jgi:hypothetical protein
MRISSERPAVSPDGADRGRFRGGLVLHGAPEHVDVGQPAQHSLVVHPEIDEAGDLVDASIREPCDRSQARLTVPNRPLLLK